VKRRYTASGVIEHMCSARVCFTQSQLMRMGTTADAILNIENKPCEVREAWLWGVRYVCPIPAPIPIEVRALKLIIESALERAHYGKCAVYFNALKDLPEQERNRARVMLARAMKKYNCERRERSYLCLKDYLEIALSDIIDFIDAVRCYSINNCLDVFP